MDGYIVEFHSEVFNMEPDFNEIKKNFLNKDGDALSDRKKEIEEYEDELESLSSLEDGEERPKPSKPKKNKMDVYSYSEGSKDEYDTLMSAIFQNHTESSNFHYELLSDEIIYSSSFNIIRNVVKYKKYIKVKKSSPRRGSF